MNEFIQPTTVDYKKNSLEQIETLFETYKDNEYITQRLYYHLSHLLPSTIDMEDKNHKKRILRTDLLTIEKQQFIQVFLNENKYYYLPNNNCFYHYNGRVYTTTKEDMIHFKLLKAISKDRKLMDWKYKTKINVLKQIRERNLFKSVPESYTIQKVLRLLHSTIFEDKTQVKYFLTVLGDNLLKKNNDLIYLIKPNSKKYLQELECFIFMLTGMNNTANNFVTKFHENYNYDKCRLVKMKDALSVEEWRNTLRANGLNIICVAAHYSQRFENADNFIHNISNNEALQTYTLYLKHNNQTQLIDQFCNSYIQTHNHSDVENTTTPSLSVPVPGSVSKFCINWKNMHYIWKLFISNTSIPNVLFSNTLKNILRERLSFDENTDTFYNVTSKYLPCVSNFIQFWEKTITTVSMNEDELEIDELCLLFKKWTQQEDVISCSNGNITETDLIKILHHFFPAIEILDNKYIIGACCSIWDKKADIGEAMLSLKKIFFDKYTVNGSIGFISFDEAYDFYSNFCSKNKTTIHFVCSKRYFEKYIHFTMGQYIEYNHFISNSWCFQ